MTVQEIGAALRGKKISVRELTEETLARVADANPRLNAFLTVTDAAARARAAVLDDELARGIDRGPLHGIPIAHKDNIFTRGVRTTSGSKIFADFVPDYDAAIVSQLNDAGANMIGKTGLHEFAYGITSNNPHFGAIRNPWDAERIPGGSSGGSAAAVAAGLVPLATGTDTGGSIRIPASFCGVVGLKPTYERVSRQRRDAAGFDARSCGSAGGQRARRGDRLQPDRETFERLRACRPRRSSWHAHRCARKLLCGAHCPGGHVVLPRGGADSGGVGSARDRDPAARRRGAQRGRTHRAAFGSVGFAGALSGPA